MFRFETKLNTCIFAYFASIFLRLFFIRNYALLLSKSPLSPLVFFYPPICIIFCHYPVQYPAVILFIIVPSYSPIYFTVILFNILLSSHPIFCHPPAQYSVVVLSDLQSSGPIFCALPDVLQMFFRPSIRSFIILLSNDMRAFGPIFWEYHPPIQ